MIYFTLRRLGAMLVILFVVSVIVFAVTEILPGDTAQLILGQRATPVTLAALRTRLGLDQPAAVRYLRWLQAALHGDLGESLVMQLPVAPLLNQRLRNTVALAVMAMLIGVPLGIALGVLAGLWQGYWLDRMITVLSLLGLSLPSFVIGSLLIIVFAAWLHWLPASSLIDPNANLLTSLKFLVLPTLTLALGMIGHIARMTRSSLIEALHSDYIRTAQAKGLAPRVITLRHALRNALLPTVSVVALEIGYLMGGAIVVENVFAYPGIGRLLLQAISSQDLPLIQSVTLVVAAFYTFINLLADLLYYYLNPRLRYA